MLLTKEQIGTRGISIAIAVISLWAVCLIFSLQYKIDYTQPLTYLLIILQMHLFTGLFITAHDAMHGVVAPSSPKLNHAIGRLCANLFVFNSYKTLRPKHYLHHRMVATGEDPDYHKGNPNFFVWYFHFLKEYVSFWQVLLAAITYNLLALALPKENLILYWIIPSFLSTFQLFYFGTYLPHRGEHEPENKHNSRSQSKNHIWAFLSCYFFGYHYEHHDKPNVPWWLLWQEKKG